MMIKPLPLHRLRKEMDLIPHAVLSVPIEHFAKLMQTELEGGEDDLDKYVGLGAEAEVGRFAIMHYRGYPKDTSTIYLPRSFPDDIDRITEAVHSILRQFKLPRKVISWERKDDPAL